MRSDQYHGDLRSEVALPIQSSCPDHEGGTALPQRASPCLQDGVLVEEIHVPPGMSEEMRDQLSLPPSELVREAVSKLSRKEKNQTPVMRAFKRALERL